MNNKVLHIGCNLRAGIHLQLSSKLSNLSSQYSNVSQQYSMFGGQTKTLFATQLKEQQDVSIYETSALVEHTMTTGHEIDWTNSTVLASNQYLDQ